MDSLFVERVVRRIFFLAIAYTLGWNFQGLPLLVACVVASLFTAGMSATGLLPTGGSLFSNSFQQRKSDVCDGRCSESDLAMGFRIFSRLGLLQVG